MPGRGPGRGVLTGWHWPCWKRRRRKPPKRQPAACSTDLRNTGDMLSALLPRRARSMNGRWRFAKSASALTTRIPRRRSTTSLFRSAKKVTMKRRERSSSARLPSTRRHSGAEHAATATSVNNLALLLRDQGDLAAARPLFERALAGIEKSFGADHPATAAGLGNLGLLLKDEGDLAGGTCATRARACH